MRVVWMLGGAKLHSQQLNKYLNQERIGHHYLIRHADKISDIPEEHLSDNGVVILLDAFHPDYMGFAGVEALKKVNCKAKCILLGEPAKEQSTKPFADSFFIGYLPPLDRVDFAFLSGLINHSLFLDGKIEIKQFLSDVGKSSTETIKNLSDFLRFEKLLRTFASKFGIDASKLKKLVMALTLQHTKSLNGKIVIQDNFPIFFGLDPKKLIVAVPTMSRGHDSKELRAEFTKAIASLSETKIPSGSMCPELFHVIQNGETLFFFSGSSKSEEEISDPCFLLARITFPSKDKNESGQGYAYCHTQVVKTEEHDEKWAKIEVHHAKLAEESAKGKNKTEKSAHAAPKATEKPVNEEMIDAEALKAILDEPEVAGDPVVATNANESNEPSVNNEPHVDPELANNGPAIAQMNAAAHEDVRALNQALYELNKICVALSKDVHTLMKNRREPSTDKELRASKEKLEANVKRLSNEIQKYQKIIGDKDKEIEELKERIKRLMSQVQSAA